MKMKTTTLAALCLALVGVSGCQRTPELDTRTFALKHMDAYTAQQIISPYVFADRAETPGTMNAASAVLTVRETPDNLDKIERVLAEYDVPRADVRLYFQLVEADGFTETDPRIAAVEAQLRSVFQFRGYRLAGEAVVSVADESQVSQSLAGGEYLVEARIRWAQPGTIRLEEVQLISIYGGRLLLTTVNIHPGQTLVVGTAAKSKSTATLLLTLRAEEADPVSPPGSE
ncbi:MAG: hypothetical protein Q8N53_10225 [Longimicrobiales bacterium]|nr:hypothetical protein [Longimicrobiales bacterium]